MPTGALIPSLTGRDQDGRATAPDDFRGKKLALFFYPIPPVSFTLIFYPHLNLLRKPNLSVLVLVKMVRNSTYKVG